MCVGLVFVCESERVCVCMSMTPIVHCAYINTHIHTSVHLHMHACFPVHADMLQ